MSQGDIELFDGNRWSRPSQIRSFQNGSWQHITEGLVFSGGKWVRFWPPRNPPTTDTFDSTNSWLWHDYSDGWFPNTWGKRPEQGPHPGTSNSHRGIWLYDSAAWRSVLRQEGGRKVTKIEIYLHRTTGHIGWGASGSVRPTVWCHNYASRPNGRPGLLASHLVSGFARGESKWVALPASWGKGMAAGTIRGFGVYSPSGGPYAAFRGSDDQANSGRIRIYHS